MCGIIGLSSDKKDITEMFKLGIILNSSRGEHAFGYSWLDKQEIKTRKFPGEVKLNSEFPEFANCIIGHTRFATNGDPKNNENNHPHYNKTMSLIHNGVVRNRHKWQKTECDSEAILRILQEYSKSLKFSEAIRKTAEEIDGGFRVAVMRKNGIWLFNDDVDPVTIAKKKGLVAFASEKKDLEKLEDWETIELADPGIIYHIQKGMIRKATTFKQKESEVTNWYSAGYDSFLSDELYWREELEEEFDDEEKLKTYGSCYNCLKYGDIVDDLCKECYVEMNLQYIK